MKDNYYPNQYYTSEQDHPNYRNPDRSKGTPRSCFGISENTNQIFEIYEPPTLLQQNTKRYCKTPFFNSIRYIPIQKRNGEFLLTDPDFDNSGGLVQMCSIGLGSSYPSLVTNSGVTRKVDVELGLERLEVNFNSLARLPMLRNNNRLTKELKAKVVDAVLHSVLIFAEGARFAPISDYVTERLRHGRWELFNLKREHESYVNFWSKLSKILVADREGLSSIEEIEAKIPDGVKFGECKFLLNDKAVDTVEDVKKIVRLLSKQSVAKSIGKLAALKSRSKSK
ncbi:hypothetical protein CASFOL_042403 [Castilleja foliolosa]|uniref:rRNA N-glycosylase n=1 Tax=Castilleja foliolosa TaxID=1961234 RepID=A0ABD3BAZ9_9LAMI